MATKLLEKYGNSITNFSLTPSGGGVYEVEKNGKLIFSKKSLDRFPEFDEIIVLIDEKLSFLYARPLKSLEIALFPAILFLQWLSNITQNLFG